MIAPNSACSGFIEEKVVMWANEVKISSGYSCLGCDTREHWLHLCHIALQWGDAAPVPISPQYPLGADSTITLFKSVVIKRPLKVLKRQV